MMGNNSPMPVCILWHPTGHTQDWFPDGKITKALQVCMSATHSGHWQTKLHLLYSHTSICLSVCRQMQVLSNVVHCTRISHTSAADLAGRCCVLTWSEVQKWYCSQSKLKTSSRIQNPDPIWCIELPPFIFLLAAGWHRHIADILHVELPSKLLNDIRHLPFCKYILMEDIVVKALLSSS